MYKILIADDEELEREALRFFINESSLDIDQVIECASGTEVIKRVMLDRPDIIVLDINMPGLNGLQALEKIKSQDYRFRAVFSTAYDYFEYAVEALRLGAVDFMVKPVKKEAFINVIMRAIDELDAEAEKEYRETKLLKTLDMMESKMVHDMVLGNMPEEVLYYLDLKNIRTECSGNCFCIRLQGSLDKCARQKLFQAVRKEFDYLDLTVMFSETNHMVTAVVFCREPDVLPGIFRRMEEFLASILKQQQIAFMMGSGTPFVDVSQIEESYEKARERVGDMVARTRCGEGGRGTGQGHAQGGGGHLFLHTGTLPETPDPGYHCLGGRVQQILCKPPFQAVYGNHGGGLPDSDPDEEGKGTAEKRDLQHQADKRYGGIFGAELLHMDI